MRYKLTIMSTVVGQCWPMFSLSNSKHFLLIQGRAVIVVANN